jgi:hypothetical protein
VINGIFDGRDGASDSLWVGDLIAIERDVEIDLSDLVISKHFKQVLSAFSYSDKDSFAI